MDRRMEIINATLDLAAENGLRTVSMQQIADRVGIKKASVYNHFSSRDEIVEAMYSSLREEAKNGISPVEINFEQLSGSYSLSDILKHVVTSYKAISTSPKMMKFYKIIMSERSLDKTAAEIMIAETKKMISATTMLFYALQAKKLIDIQNIEAAAFSFAMGVHSIIDYECDLTQCGMIDSQNTLDNYINEFCFMYGKDKYNE